MVVEYWSLEPSMTAGTYNVLLPEGVFGVVEQKFFGHIRAVEPHSAAVNTILNRGKLAFHIFHHDSNIHTFHQGCNWLNNDSFTITNDADLNASFLFSFGPFSPFMWSGDINNTNENNMCTHCAQWQGCSQAHLCGSGRGNKPGHVGFPGRSDPERWWSILSSDPRKNSSWRLSGQKGGFCVK